MAETVALVLGSGGARGLAHIGVIKEIEARGYQIISVSGCSMGAVIGGFYCAHKLDAFYEWAKSLSYMDLLRLVDFSFISNGAIRGDKVFSLLAQMLENVQIEDLDIPFTAVTTDLANSKEVWFQRGPLEQAMRASAAIPGLFQPVELNGRLFVDGGVLNPLPIAASVSAHADHIIAIDLNADVPIPDPVIEPVSESNDADRIVSEKNEKDNQPDWLDSVVNKASQWFGSEAELTADVVEQAKEKAIANVSNLGKLEILYQMFEVMQSALSQYKIAGYPPDLLVRIPQSSGEMYEFHRSEELVQMGRNIAKQALDAFEQGHSSLYGQRLG